MPKFRQIKKAQFFAPFTSYFFIKKIKNEINKNNLIMTPPICNDYCF